MPVGVQREAFVASQLRHVRQAIGQDGVGEQGAVDVAGQLAPALTGQGDKLVGALGRVCKERALFLKKGASAGGGGEHALEAQMEPPARIPHTAHSTENSGEPTFLSSYEGDILLEFRRHSCRSPR